MAFLLVVVGFWAILIGVVGIRMDLFPSASAGEKSLIALFLAGLICWIAASVILALRLP